MSTGITKDTKWTRVADLPPLVAPWFAPLVEPPKPRWYVRLAGVLVIDVLRRCAFRGCWKYGSYPTICFGRTCYEHWPHAEGASR